MTEQEKKEYNEFLEGVNEELRLLVHKSDYDKNEADEIIPVLEKIADYYITYAYWEDGNIRRDFKIKLN